MWQRCSRFGLSGYLRKHPCSPAVYKHVHLINAVGSPFFSDGDREDEVCEILALTAGRMGACGASATQIGRASCRERV